jgi:hypothetical protein
MLSSVLGIAQLKTLLLTRRCEVTWQKRDAAASLEELTLP